MDWACVVVMQNGQVSQNCHMCCPCLEISLSSEIIWFGQLNTVFMSFYQSFFERKLLWSSKCCSHQFLEILFDWKPVSGWSISFDLYYMYFLFSITCVRFIIRFNTYWIRNVSDERVWQYWYPYSHAKTLASKSAWIMTDMHASWHENQKLFYFLKIQFSWHMVKNWLFNK